METKKQLRAKISKMENETDELRKKIRLYLDSARIEEYKEFKKIENDGKITWIEYREINNEIISVNDCIYQRDMVIVNGTRISRRIIYDEVNPLYGFRGLSISSLFEKVKL